MHEAPSILRRFAALFIDWAIASVTGALVTGSSVYGAHAAPAWVPLATFFVEVTILVGLLGFSIGKRLMGIQVVGVDGSAPGLWRAAVRTALVCLVIPALLQVSDGRGVHDAISQTRQIRMTKGAKS